MPHNRFYIDAPFTAGQEISLSDNELHHLNVSRARIGQCVELINGRDQLAQASITSIDKRHALLHIDSLEENKTSNPRVILAQGLPLMHHLEWIVEKGTELGVTEFWLFPAIHSEKQTLSENQQKRLSHIILSAVKQCGRLDLPTVVLKPPLEKWPLLEGTLLFGDLSSKAPFLWKIPLIECPIYLFIGPESGFDTRELLFLKDTLHAQGVRLHPNTLRAETASLTALSLIQTILSN